ncbi:MAG: hypothetical protein WB680_08760 [Candidatus Acidiferrales bacterium]
MLEKRALAQNGVREFVFASGNLSGSEMAAALELALEKMKKLRREFVSPFASTITKKGDVHLRWTK